MQPLRLYEIFFSHFSEKARWCLDFKGIPYVAVCVKPITRRALKGLGVAGTVPVLQDGERVIDGSSAIAAYLDERFPDPPLFPADPEQRAEVAAIERRCDAELGPDARRLAYDVALEYPVLLEGMLLWGRAPLRWLNPIFLPFLGPALRAKFGVHPDEVARARARTRTLLEELQGRLSGGRYLVGDRMTLADITVAALFDPLEQVPEFVRDRSFAPIFAWKRALAAAHRRPVRIPWTEGPPPSGIPMIAADEGSPAVGNARVGGYA